MSDDESNDEFDVINTMSDDESNDEFDVINTMSDDESNDEFDVINTMSDDESNDEFDVINTMSDDESNDEFEEFDNMSGVVKAQRDKNEMRCRVCLKLITGNANIRSHFTMHMEQYALKFLCENQPVSGKILTDKFKGLDLLKLEHDGLIKYSDSENAWMLTEYIEKPHINSQFESLMDNPCMNCAYEDTCKVGNKNADPRTCNLLHRWVNGSAVKIKHEHKDFFDKIVQAKFFCAKSKKFNIYGMLEKNKSKQSVNKFVLVDKTLKSTPLILEHSMEKKLQPGTMIKITNARLTSVSHKTLIVANHATSKIDLI